METLFPFVGKYLKIRLKSIYNLKIAGEILSFLNIFDVLQEERHEVFGIGW